MTDYSQSDWAELDAGNSGVSPNGIQGGYAPSQVAPILRAMRGAAKRNHVRSNAMYTTTGTGNAYVLTYAQAPAAYVKGEYYRFFVDRANTGAATLNVNALGAKAIIMPDGSALTANQIKDDRAIEVVYNGTAFVLAGYVDQNLKFGDVSANTLTLTAALPIASGGTAATTAAAARTSLGADNASNLTLGTIADARLPTSMGSKTFTNSIDVTFNTRVIRDGAVKGQFGVLSGTGYNPYMARINADGATFDASISLQGTGANNLIYSYGGSSAVVWHAGNDGASSGLDSDLLDGQHGSYYLNATNFNAGTLADARLPTSMAGKTFTSNTEISGGNLILNHATSAELRLEMAGVLSGRLYRDSGGGLVMRRYNSTTGAAEGYIQITGNGVDDVKYNGNVMWHAGNDGAGSGLDADLLDGQSSAYYLSASNLNAGTVPNARISGAYSGITTLSTAGLLTVTTAGEALRVAGPAAADDPYITFYAGGVRQAYIQHTDGTGTGAGFRLFNDVTDDYLYLSNVNSTDALKFYDSSVATHQTVWHTGNLTLADLGGASSSISITAGNGLSGGGTLAASRTLTLGTPGTLTSGTTNSVTSTSHTHEVDEDSIVSVGMAALGAGAVGTYMFAQRVGNTNGYAFGATIGGANLESASSSSGDGTAQSGTWRCMGNIGAGSTAGGSLSLFLRIS
ncbi:hypothetical protein GOL31_23615 [Sinorhizobium medicae]|nr:hypothetical protein [Sinorhizobium medicae]